MSDPDKDHSTANSDKGSRDKSPKHEAGEPSPKPTGGKSPAPSSFLAMALFWLALLILVPLLLFFMGNRRVGKPVELTQSQFEQLLLRQRVLEVNVVREMNNPQIVLTGKYRLEAKANLPTKPETTAAPVPEKSAAPAAGAAPKVAVPDPEVQEFTATVFYSDELDSMIRKNGGQRKASSATSFWNNPVVSFLLPTLLIVGLLYFMVSRQFRSVGKGPMQFGKSRARLISQDKGKVTFADVSGIEEAKEEVQEVVDFLKDSRKFQALGGRIPKGVLMVGPPGTGKTLLARAIAGEAGVPFFSISGSDFVEMFVGVGASRVRDMFEEGKRQAPCIIFIDEIDAVGRSRFTGVGGGHDEREQTLNALLVEMDGFETNSGVIVIAATNRPDVLDPALLRPGRFDRQITIDLPDVNGRFGILKVHAKRVKLDGSVDLNTIARGTPGFSGADLANLINEAALLAARLNKQAIETGDLEEARDKVRWGKERRSRKIDEHDRAVTAYHEAGHALIGILCTKAMPLHKVTIVPRGNAYLGATMHLPEKDRYTQAQSELLDELAVLMGGRVAERLIFSDVTSGASADIRYATEIARKMVCQWGMSELVGPLCHAGREEQVFLGRDFGRPDTLSAETAREIDNEIKRIVVGAEFRATSLLTENRDKLEKLAQALLTRETVSAAEVYDLLGIPKPSNVPDAALVVPHVTVTPEPAVLTGNAEATPERPS